MQLFKLMLCVPGINDNPELWTSWPNCVCPIINKLDGWKSQPFQYLTNALTVEVNEDERVQTLADILEQYPNTPIHIMAHSNGTRVSVSALQKSRVSIETLHLICGAIDANFDSNGLNDMLAIGQIGKVFVYWGGMDQAMRLEDTLAGKALFDLPLGHQPLGLAGPVSVNQVYDGNRVVRTKWPTYDHSTCFEPQLIEGTVNQIISNANS